jgi:hypothetical protein
VIEPLRETGIKAGAGLLGVVGGYATADYALKLLGIAVALASLVSIFFDIRRKYRDRNK